MTQNRKVNILLVDDEPANLLALEATLEPLGQNLVKVTSGREALKQVLDRDFAVILLDVQMPLMNGIETAVLIRERERSRHIPIIFQTGVVKTTDMMFKGYSAGAVDYLLKPIVAGILRAKVEVFVELAIAKSKLEQEIAERARIATEITQLNMILEQRNEDLMAANADLETFGYSVSHDLRAPVRHIQAYVTCLEESAAAKLDATDVAFVNSIKTAAQRMTHLIDDLLAFSRIGRASLRTQRLSMDNLVQETLDQLRPDIGARRVDWKLTPLPEAFGDTGLLRQVWANLLANAIKYTRPQDPAVIEVTGVEQDGELVFYVRDNGVGFDPNYAHKLFGVFQRLHSEKEFEGTGIGLANVRRIVQRHGGRTWAEGERGKGATFYFTLPANRREDWDERLNDKAA